MNFRRLTTVVFITAFFFGCTKKSESPPPSPPVSHEAQMPAMNMPMMKEDPRSIKSVEGTIKEVSINEIVVFTRKEVTLKFKVDADTVIQPKEALIPGMCVTIEIQHLPYGMKAKKIQIHTAHDANHCA